MTVVSSGLGEGLLYRGFVGILVVAALGVSAYFRFLADRTSGEVSDTDGTHRVLRFFGLLFALALVAYLLAPRWIAWASIPLPPSVRYAGGAVSALAIPLLAWVLRSLGGNVTPTAGTRADHELVTSGPYRWVRHPLYSAGTAFLLGICVVSANLLLLGLFVPPIVGVHRRTPREEERLVEEFGDEYVEYMERTGRYLPHLR